MPATPQSVTRRIKVIAAFQIAAIVVIGVLTMYLAAQITALQKQRADARAELSDAAARLAQLRADATRLEQETADLEKQRQALSDRNLQLRADLTVTESTVDILKKEDPRRTARALTLAADEPRLYIQVATAENLRIAQRVQADLRNAGFNVPRVEQLPPGVKFPQVRYFRPADKDLADRAVAIAARTIPGVRAVDFGDRDVAARMRPKHLELWF